MSQPERVVTNVTFKRISLLPVERWCTAGSMRQSVSRKLDTRAEQLAALTAAAPKLRLRRRPTVSRVVVTVVVRRLSSSSGVVVVVVGVDWLDFYHHLREVFAFHFFVSDSDA